MYVVSSLFGRKVTAAATIQAATSGTDRKPDGVILKNVVWHHARVPSGNGASEMPLAARVKSRMLRLLRRSESSRGTEGGSSSRSGRKRGGGETSTVIPNTRFSVLVDSPSATRRMVTVMEPYTMALGTAGVAVTPSGSGCKHAETTKRQTSIAWHKDSCRSSSRARRLKSQVPVMLNVGTGPQTEQCFQCTGLLWQYVFVVLLTCAIGQQVRCSMHRKRIQ